MYKNMTFAQNLQLFCFITLTNEPLEVGMWDVLWSMRVPKYPALVSYINSNKRGEAVRIFEVTGLPDKYSVVEISTCWNYAQK